MFNIDLQLMAPLRKARSGGSIEGSIATREGLCEPRDSIPLPGHFLSSMLAAEDANSQLSVTATMSTACCHVSHHGLQPSGTLSPNKPFLFIHCLGHGVYLQHQRSNEYIPYVQMGDGRVLGQKQGLQNDDVTVNSGKEEDLPET